MCLDSMGPSRVENRELKVMKCHKQGGNQMFMLTENNEVREKKYCLDATRPGKPVKMLNCHGEGGNQRWVYDEDVSHLIHMFSVHLHITNDLRSIYRLWSSNTGTVEIV